jgi:hypothetical protein
LHVSVSFPIHSPAFTSHPTIRRQVASATEEVFKQTINKNIYSKTWLIRINWGGEGEVIRMNEAKRIALKDTKIRK